MKEKEIGKVRNPCPDCKIPLRPYPNQDRWSCLVCGHSQSTESFLVIPNIEEAKWEIKK